MILALVVGLAVLAYQGHDQRHQIATLKQQLAAGQGKMSKLSQRLTSTDSNVAELSDRVSKVEGTTSREVDTGTVAKNLLPSVFTIETSQTIGSAFAFQKDATGGTLLVTNFHVVADDFNAGITHLVVHQGIGTWPGQVVTVDTTDDLATVHIDRTVPVLSRATAAPSVGDPVVVAGAPLGLGGTVTSGLVSAVRDDGTIQFSAPISPGNSGGPVVDRTGRVIGVAVAKAVESGAEGIGFAIPISTVCSSLLHC